MQKWVLPRRFVKRFIAISIFAALTIGPLFLYQNCGRIQALTAPGSSVTDLSQASQGNGTARATVSSTGPASSGTDDYVMIPYNGATVLQACRLALSEVKRGATGSTTQYRDFYGLLSTPDNDAECIEQSSGVTRRFTDKIPGFTGRATLKGKSCPGGPETYIVEFWNAGYITFPLGTELKVYAQNGAQSSWSVTSIVIPDFFAPNGKLTIGELPFTKNNDVPADIGKIKTVTFALTYFLPGDPVLKTPNLPAIADVVIGKDCAAVTPTSTPTPTPTPTATPTPTSTPRATPTSTPTPAPEISPMPPARITPSPTPTPTPTPRPLPTPTSLPTPTPTPTPPPIPEATPTGTPTTVQPPSTSGAATLTTPEVGAQFSRSGPVTFSWTKGSGNVTGYWLDVGTAVGVGNIFAHRLSTTQQSVVLHDQTPLMARLWTEVDGKYLTPVDYFFPLPLATLSAPQPGSKLERKVDNNSVAVNFAWNFDPDADAYWLDVGTSLAKGDVFAKQLTPDINKQLVYQVPSYQTVYVRLWTRVAGRWQTPLDYIFTP